MAASRVTSFEDQVAGILATTPQKIFVERELPDIVSKYADAERKQGRTPGYTAFLLSENGKRFKDDRNRSRGGMTDDLRRKIVNVLNSAAQVHDNDGNECWRIFESGVTKQKAAREKLKRRRKTQAKRTQRDDSKKRRKENLQQKARRHKASSSASWKQTRKNANAVAKRRRLAKAVEKEAARQPAKKAAAELKAAEAEAARLAAEKALASRTWTDDEDCTLRDFVQQHGCCSWRFAGCLLFDKQVSAHQCEARWKELTSNNAMA